MSDKAFRTIQALGWVLVGLGLVTLLVAAGHQPSSGWGLLLGLGLMVGGVLLAGLRYIRS